MSFSRTLAAPALVVLALALAACSVSVDKSPAIIKLSKQLDALEEQQKKFKDSITSLYFDVDSLTDDISSLRARQRGTAGLTPVARKQIDAATQRVKALERRLETLSKALESQNKAHARAIAALKKSQRPRATTTASAKPAASATRARTAKAAAPRTTRTRAAEGAKPGPKGFYYKVRQGDTLSSIARSFDLPTASICEANGMPMTAAIYTNQSLYIPKM